MIIAIKHFEGAHIFTHDLRKQSDILIGLGDALLGCELPDGRLNWGCHNALWAVNSYFGADGSMPHGGSSNARNRFFLRAIKVVYLNPCCIALIFLYEARR